MDSIQKLNKFFTDLSNRSGEHALVEAIKQGFDACFESFVPRQKPAGKEDWVNIIENNADEPLPWIDLITNAIHTGDYNPAASAEYPDHTRVDVHVSTQDLANFAEALNTYIESCKKDNTIISIDEYHDAKSDLYTTMHVYLPNTVIVYDRV